MYFAVKISCLQEQHREINFDARNTVLCENVTVRGGVHMETWLDCPTNCFAAEATSLEG